MNAFVIFLIGLMIGLLIEPLNNYIRKSKEKKSNKLLQNKVLSKDKMIVPNDFNEVEYISTWLKKIEHSMIMNLNNWECYFDHSEIELISKKEDGKSIEVKLNYSIDEKIFSLSNIRIYSNSRYDRHLISRDADISKELYTFIFKKYLEWRNVVNLEKKSNIDEKLKIVDEVLGKTVERDMSLDKLIG